MKALVLYSSHDGQAKAIMSEIASTISRTISCELCDINEFNQIELDQYQIVLIGAAIRYGFFNKKVKRFVNQHYQQLNAIPTAFVSINLIARKPAKRTLETNVYTRKFLANTPWKPDMCEIIAGALRYSMYGWLDKTMIQLIMKISGGETDTSKDVEYTDWRQVKDFANRFLQYIENKQLNIINW